MPLTTSRYVCFAHPNEGTRTAKVRLVNKPPEMISAKNNLGSNRGRGPYHRAPSQITAGHRSAQLDAFVIKKVRDPGRKDSRDHENMDSFLADYTRVSKDDIRRNRENIGERLGFLGRVVHGSNSRKWAKELPPRIGETADFAGRGGRD